MKSNNKIIMYIVLIGLILISAGVTYAYFTANVDGNESTSTLVATGGILEIHYDGGPQITMPNIYPREAAWVSKVVTLTGTNTTDLKMNYRLKIESVSNTFTYNSLTFSITKLSGTNGTPIANQTNQILNVNNDTLLGYGSFYNGNEEVHQYRIDIYYKDNGKDQNINQGANFTGRIVIEEAGTGEIEEPKIYGVKRDVDTSSSAWIRTDDAVGLVANAQFGDTPVQNDFDNIYPWSDIISYNYSYSNGEVTETMYGEAGFTFDGTNGEVLTRIPEFYYTRYQETVGNVTTEYQKISNEALPGYIKSDVFSVGRYTISGEENDIHSRSGVQPLVNTTITNFRRYIQETTTLGNDFGQMDYHYFILQLLYLVEYADYNSQAKLGLGNTSNSAAVNSGGTNTLGMKSGTLDENNAGTSSMIYRGIEDIFGNIMQYVDGINIKEYVTYICTDQTQYAVDTFTGCYKPVGYTNLTSSGVFPNKLGYDADNPLVAMPIASGGSDSTHITDYYWSTTENAIALGGGGLVNTSMAGLWFWKFNDVSSGIGPGTGARLLRYN